MIYTSFIHPEEGRQHLPLCALKYENNVKPRVFEHRGVRENSITPYLEDVLDCYFMARC